MVTERIGRLAKPIVDKIEILSFETIPVDSMGEALTGESDKTSREEDNTLNTPLSSTKFDFSGHLESCNHSQPIIGWYTVKYVTDFGECLLDH